MPSSEISEAFAESAKDLTEKDGFRLHAAARNTCVFGQDDVSLTMRDTQERGALKQKSSIKGVEDMKTTEQVKTDTKKLELTVKSAGELAKVFVTPGMAFNKA